MYHLGADGQGFQPELHGATSSSSSGQVSVRGCPLPPRHARPAVLAFARACFLQPVEAHGCLLPVLHVAAVERSSPRSSGGGSPLSRLGGTVVSKPNEEPRNIFSGRERSRLDHRLDGCKTEMQRQLKTAVSDCHASCCSARAILRLLLAFGALAVCSLL